MQSFLWFGLVVATGACATGLTQIFRGARKQLKSRRRAQQVRKWVQSETMEGNPRVRALNS